MLGATGAGLLPKWRRAGNTGRPLRQQGKGLAGQGLSKATRTDPGMVAGSNTVSYELDSVTATGQASHKPESQSAVGVRVRSNDHWSGPQ